MISESETVKLQKWMEREIEKLRSFPVPFELSWIDERVPVTAVQKAGVHDPTFLALKTNGAGSQGVYIYWFAAAIEEELFFTLQLPHSWKQGSNIHPHVHWVPALNGGVGTSTVVWGLEYTWANITAVYGNTTLITAMTHYPADATLVAGKHYMTEFTEINAAGKTMSSMLVCRVYRKAADGADTYTGLAGLLEIDFHIQIDSPGSRQEMHIK